MKHSLKIVILLLGMFFFTQIVGLIVVKSYSPKIIEVIDEEGNVANITNYNLPYGMEPPQDVKPGNMLISIIISIAIAVIVILILMKYRVELFLRIWFFVVVALALAITINSFILNIENSSLIALAVSIPLAFLKLFKRNIILHNFTELLIYPGIAAIFVPLLNVLTVVLLLILISIYDMYAVWHVGFMQKMAQYQIKNIRVFTGFFVPYLGKKQKEIISKTKLSKLKNKKVKVSVAILGGGDIVFPSILAGIVMFKLGLPQALLIVLGATLALAALFYLSEKGKFYPAMPFITLGCFIALAVAYLV